MSDKKRYFLFTCFVTYDKNKQGVVQGTTQTEGNYPSYHHINGVVEKKAKAKKSVIITIEELSMEDYIDFHSNESEIKNVIL